LLSYWIICKDDGYCRWGSFAGLNFCGFDPMEYFAEMLSWFIGQECLSIIIKEVLNYFAAYFTMSYTRAA